MICHSALRHAHPFSSNSPIAISMPSVGNSSRLAGKICIVTGAASGLGRAIALAFASNGAGLIICADLSQFSSSTFGSTSSELPTHEAINALDGESRAIFMHADVTRADDVARLVRTAVENGGRLDVMVNNAGIGGTEGHGPCHEMDEGVWDRLMDVNAKSVFLGCKYSIAQFLSQQPHPQGSRGWIINTASVQGLVGLGVNGAAYSASKGAVVLLTKSVALEYGKEKIHVNAICPGYTATPMTEIQARDEGRKAEIERMIPWGGGEWGKAEDVAGGAVFLASEDANYVTGVALPVDGGYLAQ